MSLSKTAKFKRFVRTHQLVAFIVLALAITVAMTVVGLEIYDSSGAIKLDLSRPGYEKVRQDIQKSDPTQTKFQPSGNLDDAAMTDFNSRLDKLQLDLKNSGNFGSSISDQSLNLAQ